MSNTSAINLPIAASERDDAVNPAFWRGNLYLRSFENARPVWNDLLNACDTSLYHREQWLKLLIDAYRLKLHVATLERNGRVSAGCVFARSKNPFSSHLRSLPYSDYCAPLETSPGARGELLNALTRCGKAGAWEIRGTEGTPLWSTVNCFSTWVLDLARPLSAIERNVNEAYRRQARRARAEGVRIEMGRDGDAVERFYTMYLETRRRLGVPAQPRRLFDLARDAFAPREALQVWIASHLGKDLAGLILLIDQGRLYYKWAARLLEGPSGANHQLVWSVVEEFAGRAAALDLGRTDDRNEGLVRFKRHLGAERIALPYTYFPKAPKNVSAEVPAGAHRLVSRLWRRLPPRVARALGGVIYSYLA